MPEAFASGIFYGMCYNGFIEPGNLGKDNKSHMKKSKLLYLIVGMIICMMLCSCNAAPPVTQGDDKGTDPEAGADASGTVPDEAALESVYSELLDGIYDLILSDEMEADVELAEAALNGIMDVRYALTPAEALDSIGYTFCDLNSDGMPELIVSSIIEKADGKCFGRDIYAVYTCVQDEISIVCSGWSRSYVGWIGGNEFYYLGSGGADMNVLGHYELLPNASDWTCIDVYFTEEDSVYHNQIDAYDKEDSEATDMTRDDFWELDNELCGKVQKFELTPFSTLAHT